MLQEDTNAGDDSALSLIYSGWFAIDDEKADELNDFAFMSLVGFGGSFIISSSISIMVNETQKFNRNLTISSKQNCKFWKCQNKS